MTVLLIANIGNSDVELADETLLPPALQGPTRRRVRVIGEELNRDLPKYAPHVRLPLLGPTLRWLVEQEGVAVESIRLVLCATNQEMEITREEERQKDTLPMAEAASKLLTQLDSFRTITGMTRSRAPMTSKQINVRTITGSPADYSNMLAWYATNLPAYLKHVQDGPVYLEVSGGTPAMTAMLILAGVEVFAPRAHTLYINRGDSQPYEVSVAGELYAQRIRRTLRTQVELYAYAVALRTLQEYERQISSDERRRDVLAALLYYADRRLAFDFDEARSALSRARQATTGDAQARVQYWLRQLESTDTALQLAELLHSTRIKHSFGDYMDFAQRLFRFQEASLRYIDESLGMQTKDKDGMYLDLDWMNAQPGLAASLSSYDLLRPLNRVTLGAIAEYFMQQGKRPEWMATVQQLQKLSAAAELRNKGLSGHGFQGISREKLEEKYQAPLQTMLADLEAIYCDLFGKEPGQSPYDAVNALLDTLL